MAIQFGKTQGFLSGYPSSGLPASNSNYTLMCWINGSSAVFGGGVTASICGIYNGTYNASTAPTTACQIGTKTGTTIDIWSWGGANLISSITPYTAMSANTWYHITYTYNAATTTHQLYINGILNNTAINSTQITGTFTQLYLNGYPQIAPATNETSASQVDGVRVFTRILSGNEILTIYNSRGFQDGIAYGQVANYIFNGPIGVQASNIYDLSGLNSSLNTYATTTNTLTYISGPINNISRAPL
jgi:hypothetical protein